MTKIEGIVELGNDLKLCLMCVELLCKKLEKEARLNAEARATTGMFEYLDLIRLFEIVLSIFTVNC
jgi:hypothetical protein